MLDFARGWAFRIDGDIALSDLVGADRRHGMACGVVERD